MPRGVIVAGAFLIAALSASWNQAADVVSAQEGAAVRPVSADKDTIATYCVTCHSDRRKTGGLSLSSFDPAEPLADRDTAEKVIRKLRAGMMPPPGAKRPGAVALDSLADSLERIIDAAAAASPDPGWRPFQRLNRAEYRQAILDLVGVEVAVEGLLPADTISAGFDNVADVQTFSPIVVTRYLRAASHVSALAVASPTNRKVFVCWPRGAKDEAACADRILTALVGKAYRGTAIDLQVLAFTADISRVFSFKLGRDNSNRTYPESGVSGAFHPTSHHGGRIDRLLDFAKINAYHVGTVAHLLERLKATPDLSGSMLDHTLVMYGSPMGDSNLHDHKRVPFFLAGHAGGALKGGVHLKAEDGTPLSNVMLSLLHAVGADDLSSFGDSDGTFAVQA